MAEGDESDRSLAPPAAADRSRHERRARPPRVVRVAGRGRAALRRLARGASGRRGRHPGRGGSSPPGDLLLVRPGRAQPRETPRAALAALERGRRRRGRGAGGARRTSAAPAGASRRVGEAGGVRVVDDYAPPSDRDRCDAGGRPRGDRPRKLGVVVLFQPHLYSRTLHLAHELARSPVRRRRRLRHRCLRGAGAAGPGRRPASSSSTASSDAPARACGRLGAGLRRRCGCVAAEARPGDLVLTIGAGDVDPRRPRHSRAHFAP